MSVLSNDEAVAKFLGLVADLHNEIRGDYGAAMRGRHNKSFDKRGIHITSYLYGKLELWGEHTGITVESLEHYKVIALADARDRFIHDVAIMGAKVFDHPDKSGATRG